MLHPLPLPLSSCLGCIPPLIGLPSLRFYAVGSSLFLLSVCFCLCSLFYRDDVLCWLLLARPFLYAFHAHLRFPVDLVWFRLSCDHGWIRSGSVNVRKQQQQQQLRIRSPETGSAVPSRVSLRITILRLNRVLIYWIPPEIRGGVHLYIQTAIRHRVSPEVTGSRNCVPDGVHCRESAAQGHCLSR